MMTPRKQANVFASYANLITMTTDIGSLEEITKQFHQDSRLTRNQVDALIALLARTKITLRRLPTSLQTGPPASFADPSFSDPPTIRFLTHNDLAEYVPLERYRKIEAELAALRKAEKE